MLKVSRRFKSTLHGAAFDAAIIGGGHNGLVAVSFSSILCQNVHTRLHLVIN